MPGPPRQFDEDEVLRVASDVFRERGYAQTSLSEIQRRAGLSRQSLYNAFESKETLFAAVLDLYDRQELSELVTILRGEGRGRERLLAVFEALAKTARKADCPGCLYGNVAGELGTVDPEVHARLLRGFARVEDAARDAAADAVAEGDLDPELVPRDVARLIVSLVEGVSLFNRLHSNATYSQSLLRVLRRLLRA